MTFQNQINLLTYNIQFSKHPKEIIENISKLSTANIDVICLQEVVFYKENDFVINKLLKKLGSDWQSYYYVDKNTNILGMGTCILWNVKKLTLDKADSFLLPQSESLAFHEAAFSWVAGGIAVSLKRRIISCTFISNNKKIRITNVHLDHNGGLSNRKKQLQFLLLYLKKTPVLREIICGDFNSFDLLKNGKEKDMHQNIIGKEFVDISLQSDWTADFNNIDINRGKEIFTYLIKKLNIHIRRKLDYIWVKNMTCISCEKLIWKGSDHLPLFAKLKS